MKPIVTFISDFGQRDGYVAQVKARILSHHPDACIVDITHQIPPHDIISGAWLIHTTYSWFPNGSIHLAIVDPGVGSERAIIAVEKDGHILIGPDSGVFSFIYPADKVIEVKWRPSESISPTFHGRDIFAPLVGVVLDNDKIENLGPPMDSPVILDVHRPMIVHIDRFGNIITNLDCKHLRQGCRLTVSGVAIALIAKTFTDIPYGELGLVCGSASTIEIVANQARAADIIDAKIGMPVSLSFG